MPASVWVVVLLLSADIDWKTELKVFFLIILSIYFLQRLLRMFIGPAAKSTFDKLFRQFFCT